MKSQLFTTAAVLALGLGAAAVALRREAPDSRVQSDVILDEAIEFFADRLVERPHDFVAALVLADRYMMRFGSDRDIADVWRADTTLRRALDTHARFAPALARLASVHIARHEFPEAQAAAQSAFRLAPRRASNGPLFDTYFELGQYDSARATLSRMDPNSFGYLTRKARFAQQLGYGDIARNSLARACRPTGSSDHRLRAWCAVRQADLEATLGRPSEAQHLYREALRHWPNYSAALTGLAGMAFKEARLEVAGELYRRVAHYPGGVEAHLMLARIAALGGDSAGAANEHRLFEDEATRLLYGRAYWPALARHFSLRGQHARALKLARQDVAQRPGPEAYSTLAVVLLNAGHAAQARAAIDSALTWGPPDAEGLYHWGLIRIGLRDHVAGRKLLREALADPAGLDPDYSAVAEAHLVRSKE